MIAVICPTRGIIFTEVIQSIESMRHQCGVSIYSSTDLSVPEAFNVLTQKALKEGCTELFYIEEDTVPPKNSIQKLLQSLESDDIACIEYPVVGGHSTVVKQKNTNTILYCGLGCTLIKSSVFKKLPFPWFRADKAFQLSGLHKNEWTNVDATKQYGLYDVRFFCEARRAGCTIAQIPGVCRHLEVKEKAKGQENNGFHTIGLKSETIVPSYLSVDPMEFL